MNVPSHIFSFLSDILAFPPQLAYRDSTKQAWCDGFKIGSSPWHCLCCTRITNRLRGIKRRKYLKECNTRNIGPCSYEMVVDQNRMIWVWPQEKHVFPDVDGWKYSGTQKVWILRGPQQGR